MKERKTERKKERKKERTKERKKKERRTEKKRRRKLKKEGKKEKRKERDMFSTKSSSGTDFHLVFFSNHTVDADRKNMFNTSLNKCTSTLLKE